MNTTEKLKEVRARLEAKGAKDVKFYFRRDPSVPRTVVMQHVVDALEAVLDGKCKPLPPFNDSKGHRDQAA